MQGVPLSPDEATQVLAESSNAALTIQDDGYYRIVLKTGTGNITLTMNGNTVAYRENGAPPYDLVLLLRKGCNVACAGGGDSTMRIVRLQKVLSS